MSAVSDLLEQLRTYSSAVCLEGDRHSDSYGDLLSETQQWQAYFDAVSVGPGCVVGLRADYSLQAVGALLALFARKAIVALLSRDVNSAENLDEACIEAVLEIAEDGAHTWRAVSPRRDHPLLDSLRASGEAGLMMFTSGSTGHPKAALHSVERFLRKYQGRGRRLRTLAFLLFDHVAGQDTLFYTLWNGGALIRTRRRDPVSILELIEAHRVEVLPVSPSFLRLLCATTVHRAYDLSSLRVITYGSEPMDPGTLVRLNQMFPTAQISQKYGTTETGSPRSVSRGNDSLWVKIKSVETKVIDGVLWLRGAGTMLGYLNAPSAIDEQGWYCTGDLVEVDGEWLRFRGRAADVFKVGGEKVAPAEVEQSILEVEIVRDVVVAGEPHPLLGQVVMARVLLTETAREQVQPKDAALRIRAHCRAHLAPYKVPVRIEFTTEALTTTRQKAQRKSPLTKDR